MQFKDALAAVNKDDHLCAVGRWLSDQDNTTNKDITEALATLPSYRVWRACQQLGLKSAHQTWLNHYAKTCRCGQ